MGIYLIYFACLKLRFPDVEVNPGPRRAAPKKCRILYSNIRGLSANKDDLAVASVHYDVLLCAETLVSNRRHLSELHIPGFGRPICSLRGSLPRSRGLSMYVRDGFCAFRQAKYECKCCEMQIVRVCGSRNNFYLFSCYRNPDLHDGIFDCLLTAMATIQSEDRKASFLVIGDFNAKHREWLNSGITDNHGVAALNFATVAGCTQLVTESTHVAGNVLDLVMTDVPDLTRVAVQAPLGSSDHSSLAIVLSTAQAFQVFV